jgi:hypothetical protein
MRDDRAARRAPDPDRQRCSVRRARPERHERLARTRAVPFPIRNGTPRSNCAPTVGSKRDAYSSGRASQRAEMSSGSYALVSRSRLTTSTSPRRGAHRRSPAGSRGTDRASCPARRISGCSRRDLVGAGDRFDEQLGPTAWLPRPVGGAGSRAPWSTSAASWPSALACTPHAWQGSAGSGARPRRGFRR